MRIATIRLTWTALERTVRMRLLQAVVPLFLGILLPGSIQADAVTFITTVGADFQNFATGSVESLSQGLTIGGFSDSGGHFAFSNPLAPGIPLFDGANESLVTGPLVSHKDISWIFGGWSV